MRNAPILLALLLAAGCGARSESRFDGGPSTDGASSDASAATDSGADTDAGPERFPVQSIEDACAPDDGPALRLELFASGTPCMGDPTAPSVSMYIYEGDTRFLPIEPGETVTLLDGAGTHCLGGAAPCRVAPSGSITFDTFVDGVSASGSWSLTFTDGETMTGTFDAAWCEGDVLCG